jgi:putative methionine-R-sulfoxide reductase with GAF domain
LLLSSIVLSKIDEKMRAPLSYILRSFSSRESKASRVVERIKQLRGYSWLGLFDVKGKEISLFAGTGNILPKNLRHSTNAGLAGQAVKSKDTVVANDISLVKNSLPAFPDTQSQVAIPVFSYDSKTVIGIILVESLFKNAFDSEDIYFLEECAMLLSNLWEE